MAVSATGHASHASSTHDAHLHVAQPEQRLRSRRRAAMDRRRPRRLRWTRLEPWIERSWRRCLAAGQRPAAARGLRRGVAPQALRRVERSATTQLLRRRGRCSTSCRAPSPTPATSPILTDATGHGGRRRTARSTAATARAALDRAHRRRPVGARGGHHRHRRRAGRAAAGLAAPRRALLRRHQRLQLRRRAAVRPRRPLRRHAGPDRRRRCGAAGAAAPGRAVGAQHRERAGAGAAACACCCASTGRARVGGDGDGLCASTPTGRVAAANAAARQLLRSWHADAAALQCSDLFAMPLAMLFDAAGHTATSKCRCGPA